MSLFRCGGDFYVHAKGRPWGLGLTPPRGRGRLCGGRGGCRLHARKACSHLQLHVPHTVTPSGSESGRPKADVFVSRSIKAASKNLQKAFLGEYEFEW